jgi:hypothetical protein
LVDINIPIPLFYLRIPLMHPAVNSEPMAMRLNNVTGTGYRPCRAHEFYFHKYGPQDLRKFCSLWMRIKALQ